MSPDPVLAAIDDVIADHEALSMQRNAEKFNPFPGVWMPGTVMTESSARCAPLETAVGPGWVSPPQTRYEPVEYATVVPYGQDARRRIAEYRQRRAARPDPFGGPVPCPGLAGAAPHLHQDAPAPSNVPAGNDVQRHRAAHPMRVFWDALAKRVRR